MYFLSSSDSQTDVFRWTEGELASWTVGDPSKDPDLKTGIQNTVAAGVSGVAWVGSGQALFRVDTSSGAVSKTSLPAPTVSDHGPPFAGYFPVVALSAAADGRVAAVRDGASVVQILAPGGAVSTISLGAAWQPVSAVFDGNGYLAIGAYTGQDRSDGEIAVIDPAGSIVKTVLTGGTSVVALAGGGFQLTSVVDTTATVRTISDSAVLAAARTTTVRAGLTVPVLSVTAPSGAVVLATTSGVAIIRGSTETDLALPTWNCSGGAVPALPPGDSQVMQAVASAAAHGTCPERPTALAVDSTGTIWGLPTGPQDTTLAQITP